MGNERIWILIAKKLTGNASAGDLEKLNNLIKDDLEMQQTLMSLAAFWEQSELQISKEETLIENRVRIYTSIQKRKK